MSSWTGQGGPGGSSGSEFIHVDHDGHAGSSPGSGTTDQLTDQTIPEDQAAIRRLGEDVRKAGAAGAQAAVGALRTRMADKNATPESPIDAQRQIADPSFVNTLKSIASDPNVRASLKTWASQIRIGDPAEASELASITGLDEHLSEGVASQTPRRPPANIPGTASFQGRPQLATTEEVDEPRSAITAHNSGSQLFGAPMPGGFGLDGGAFDANGSVAGGSNGTRDGWWGGAQPLSHPAPPSGWGEDEDGVQSDAPSTRSKRTTKTKSRLGRSTLGVATPSIDGGREARSRLDQQIPRHEHSSSTLASSFGADGTMSEVESTHTPGGDSLMYARHHGTGIPVPPITVPAATPVPTVAPQVLPPSRQRSISPDPIRVPRRRSPSPRGARSRMASRARAESRRRPAPAADPAAMLIELTGVQFVRARKDYDALRDDELSLNEGDILAVIKREADGRYWLGHIQGQVGRFPVHVVDVLSHQSRTQGDSTAQEEKTTELLRRAREIEDFMEHLHEFDITRHCITDDDDIQADLSSLLELRREVVRHLDETTTGIGRLKAMLNQIKQAQRVHDRLIDSRIAGYAARTAIHDETPRMNYQDLPSNMGYPYAAPPFDMTPYARRTSGMPPQQIEQAPRDGISPYRAPGDHASTRKDIFLCTCFNADTQQSPDDTSMYATEPNTPGEPLIAGATNGQFPLPMSAQTGGWGESERGGTVKDDVGRTTRSGRNRGPSDTSAHTHTSRRGAF
ncbi:GAT domain [Rhizoctonia solani]|uniref:GAT domain n=1 Tax=Rhizoctonia solani TaxID=456999 RepID=A0A8H7IIZ0_9AGAM|nr:GAT domain [Rhizoctonia solani]